MKNLIRLFGNLNREHSAKVPLLIIALAVIIGFSMIACDSEDNGGGPQTVTFTGIANGETYTLEVTQNVDRAVYVPQGGDTYVLTVGTRKSTGTVTTFNSSTGELTLQPSVTDAPSFTAVVSASSMALIALNDPITMDDGEVIEDPPAELAPANPFTGTTWAGVDNYNDYGTLEFTSATNWKMTYNDSHNASYNQTGTYTFTGNSATLKLTTGHVSYNFGGGTAIINGDTLTVTKAGTTLFTSPATSIPGVPTEPTVVGTITITGLESFDGGYILNSNFQTANDDYGFWSVDEDYMPVTRISGGSITLDLISYYSSSTITSGTIVSLYLMIADSDDYTKTYRNNGNLPFTFANGNMTIDLGSLTEDSFPTAQPHLNYFNSYQGSNSKYAGAYHDMWIPNDSVTFMDGWISFSYLYLPMSDELGFELNTLEDEMTCYGGHYSTVGQTGTATLYLYDVRYKYNGEGIYDEWGKHLGTYTVIVKQGKRNQSTKVITEGAFGTGVDVEYFMLEWDGRTYFRLKEPFID